MSFSSMVCGREEAENLSPAIQSVTRQNPRNRTNGWDAIPREGIRFCYSYVGLFHQAVANHGNRRPPLNDSPAWERVQALFDRVLELDSEPREALLADVALEDPALAAEVRSLLSAHVQA